MVEFTRFLFFPNPISLTNSVKYVQKIISTGKDNFFQTYFLNLIIPILGLSRKTEIYRPKDLRLGPFNIHATKKEKRISTSPV